VTSSNAVGGQLIALESHLLDWVQAAVLVTDLTGVVTYANQHCEVLYGRNAKQLIGLDALCFDGGSNTPGPMAPGLFPKIASEVLHGRNWEGDFRIERADGAAVDVHAVNSPLFDDSGKVVGIVSLAYDINTPPLSQAELRRIIAVAQILRDIGQTLVAELDAERVLRTVTGAARKLTGASMATFLGLDSDHDAGGFIVRAHSGRTRADSMGATLATDEPLLAAALAGEGPVRFDDLSLEPERAAALDMVLPSPTPPLRSCIVMPVRSRAGQVMGAMVVAHTEAERFASTEERLLADIAAQAGIVLDIARLFRAAEVEISARRRAEEVQRFFAETSAVLSSSLAYPESFEQVGRLCVPFLADLCLIDVAEEHGVRRLAAVHSDSDKSGLVAELVEKYSPDPYGSHPAASVVRGGPPEVAGTLSDEFLRATTHDDRHFDIVKQLEFTSYMCVPLEARGRTLGALTLVSSGSGRSFGPAELVLAVEFARRAGLALDNARLYSERDHVARALQSSLLPPSLPVIPGARVTARYRAAGEGNEVGGDFYHVFQVDRDAWWFVIGDVSGKGPEAAAIAGLARHTLRALALHERSPRQLLTALHDTLMRGEGRGEFVTVCCALLQPDDDGVGARLSLACGGHPPPITRRADNTVELTTCTGPLLGLPVKLAFEEQSIHLAPGDTVVLYTDGVTEAHHRNQEQFGEERLVEVIRNAGDGVDEVADAIVAAVSDYGPVEPRDDVAVVVLRIEP
jgi:PAS domain S-box-containing protein